MIYNLQSLRGVPISTSNGVPPGSDGRMPAGLTESGSANLAAPNQFQSYTAFGGVAAHTNWSALSNSPSLRGTNSFSAVVAADMQLPCAYAGTDVVLVQRRAVVGSAYVGIMVNLSFGSVIEVPMTDERNQLLTNMVKELYWQPEPFSLTGNTNGGYYWSPHAQQVFAIQAGLISVTWRKMVPYLAASVPTDYTNQFGSRSFETNGNSIFLLYTVNYMASGSAVKPAKKMYWTENEFRLTGVPVLVSPGRVSQVNVVYNNNFPRNVDTPYRGPGYTSPTEGSTNQSLSELRTLWYDPGVGCVLAYNQEGRVFVEFLGDATPDGLRREHLGFEIVDVYKNPVAADITVELGERLAPPAPDSADFLFPQIVQVIGSSFTYSYLEPASGHPQLYATRTTSSKNDCLVHWLEAGVVGIKWPMDYVRYQQIWPTDVGKYSHYIRPLVANETEAKQTAVALSFQNTPVIAYQDPLDQPRAKITEDGKFYTFLTPAYPAHRTLLRYSSGEYIGFERVFSWLDTSLRNTNLTDSVSMSLSEAANYENYPAAYVAYTNYLAQYITYSNQLAAFTAYASYLAQYNIYTNQLAAYLTYSNWLASYTAYSNRVALTTFQTDFSATTNKAALYGNATITNGSLHLTEAVASQCGTYILNYLTNQAVTNFVVSFNVRIGSNSTPPADGFSLFFGTVLDALLLAPQEAVVNGIAVCWDTYDNGTGDYGIGIEIKTNGVHLASVAVPLTNMLTTNYFVPVQIVLSNGTMDVYYRGVKYLSSVATGYVPRTGRFGLGASTGSSWETHWIDDLSITINSGYPPYDPGAAPTYAADPGAAPTAVAFASDPGSPPATVSAPAFVPDVWTNVFVGPHVVRQTVEVGQRLAAPAGEPGSAGGYLAGYINAAMGQLYNPGAYVDPLAAGFTAAATGAIIPVNAVPGTNWLEVWWFRTNSTAAGMNAGNTRLGFQTAFWPSVLGRYTIVWPSSPREIVLASKLGSGTLDPMEALGVIYRQNDPTLPGYNPNEEHAIMAGGTAFATRDDLNLTNTGNYSSAPFVLIDYKASDGRPAMSVFKVLREKPEAGYVFDYISPAGQILQPPMPLPLLAKPVLGTGDNAVNYNTEVYHPGGDLPGSWNSDFANSDFYGHYAKFMWRDRHHDFWVYRGPHAGLPDLQAGKYDTSSGTFISLPAATAVVSNLFTYTIHASRQDEYLSVTALEGLPGWLTAFGLTLAGIPDTNHVGTNTYHLVVEDFYIHDRVTNVLTLAVVSTGFVLAQGPLALACTNTYSGTVVTFSNRPPFLAASPTAANSFSMRYYYKTEASFDWPGIANPPDTGSIVPYLRPINPATGQFVGDSASDRTPSLEVVYRPVWPERDPSDSSKAVGVLPFGATLTMPEFNLPGVRDMLTAEILYQQSIASDLSNAAPSATLHDATREKYSDLDGHSLAALPAGVVASAYQGLYYFPNLPPHLAQRVFFDPNRGAKGSLVLAGQFVQETLGENYVLLNVLRGSDLAAVIALCPDGDNDKGKWNGLVNDLATDVETFYENPAIPGTYIPNGALTQSTGVGDLAVITSGNTAVDSYAISANGPGSGYVVLVEASGTAFTKPSDPVAMHIFRVDASQMYMGEVKVITAANPLSEYITFQHTADLAGRFTEYEYEWKIAQPVDGLPPVADATMSRYVALGGGTDLPRYTIGGAGILALCDNYVVMRYRPKNPEHPLYNQWSDWTAPKLGEGWIKRVLAGINPFTQRITDLFNNQVNTDVSMLTQAGKRWEGDVALNLATMNNYGLIEIYETVLRRGRMLSIESGYNYGPANDALLLAAGYLNDLYMMLAGEAWADAANPTIGIGTKDKTYGDIATALFSFKGQVASLLEEELALLRGRDDFLLPGVQVTPIYNRLVWNYTRGIDSGEVIYALNYNILPRPDNDNGTISALDAAYMFPQGHGDAYGHYLTALKGYYSLLMNSCFDWVPRIEAVNVLGQPISVDYMDERKFAAAAVGVARAGQQILDLTWRQDYQPVATVGWDHFGTTRANTQRQYSSPGTNNYVTRYWGMDHWATRTEQGAYFHWIVGNAILPDVDPNPNHEGIQKIDRTTVPELSELVTIAQAVQTSLDNAEAGLSPLGIPEGGLAFDINPNEVVGADGGTHFEQIYQRATVALNNAVASFDDAKDVTGLMRSEQDSLTDFQASVASQEMAYRNSLIELYGTPYADDIGPGKTWTQGYTGPDLIHYAYVDNPESDFSGNVDINPDQTYNLSVQQLPSNWIQKLVDYDDTNVLRFAWFNSQNTIPFHWGPHGFFDKPSTWSGSRKSPGKIQQAISDVIKAHEAVTAALSAADGANQAVSDTLRIVVQNYGNQNEINGLNLGINIAQEIMAWADMANEIAAKVMDETKTSIETGTADIADALPSSLIAGMACGGDLTSAAKGALEAAGFAVGEAVEVSKVVQFSIFKALDTAMSTANRWSQYRIAVLQAQQADRQNLLALGSQVSALGDNFAAINSRLREYNDAYDRYRGLVAQGDRILDERLSFRQRAATIVQGYRTRDAAFRLFRDEKLERYKTLFDLAARYALLAANAYDYETGLLGTSTGSDFKKRMINARALGVVRNGEPQFAGSDTGDPGLSSALAEMKADWDVLRGRLGFNNPDAYGTTFSLRTEALRILPTSDSDTNWKDVLQAARKANILDDGDVRRYCMQIDDGSGLAVPGLVLAFSSTVADGYNFFGQELAAGDHSFSPSSFATKIFGVGVAFIGYRGMDNPTTSSGTGTSPSDPSLWYLDPLALSSTPYVYLIPVGVDSMRTPPLGDTSNIRTWTVQDVAIPMPFNIGASDFSTKQLWQGNDSLTEPLFTIRKHQAFRPVSTTDVFSPSLYGDTGSLRRSQFTNNRLVGRSVWNSQWKLVIPGRTLLNDPNAGLDRFIQTVTDVKLHFVTYSYSGN